MYGRIPGTTRMHWSWAIFLQQSLFETSCSDDCSIYWSISYLRRCAEYLLRFTGLTHSDNSVDPLVVSSWLYFHAPTYRWNPFGLCSLWFWVAHLPCDRNIRAPQGQSRRDTYHRDCDKRCSGSMHWKCASLDPQ